MSIPEKAVAQLESNFIENNRGNGILYDGQEGIVISKNKLSGNSKHGISLLRSNEITLQSNIIRNNLLSGVHVEIGVCCSILENGIFDNKEYGIFSGGVGVVKGNDILGHVLPSLFLRSLANVTILKNRLHSWKHECVYIEEKSRVTLEDNEFFLFRGGAKETCIHPESDTMYEEKTNTLHLCDFNFQQKDKEGLTVEDLCLAIDLLDYETLKPKLQSLGGDTAPFFTSLELNVNRKRQPQSSFCNLL